ncbi:MAG: hypothetical protein R3E86_16255 [Pseudomonadales bacterium]
MEKVTAARLVGDAEPGVIALQKWIDAVNAREVEALVAMYDSTARLLPTFSPHFMKTAESIRAYFEALVSRPNVSVELHTHAVVAQQLAETVYGVSGMYSFRFEVDEVLLTFPSRFSFVIDTSKASPIVHHHSSQVPRNLS